MSIIEDLKNLTEQQRRHILRAANRHMKKLPATHTVILTKRPTVKTAQVLTDFELIIYASDDDGMRQMCGEVNDESDGTVSEISADNIFGAKQETYRVIHPSLHYKQSARLVEPEESVALTYDFENIYKETHDTYLEFLAKHLMFFIKKDFMNITTVNTTEMEKDCPLYSRLFIIYHSRKDYVLYNRDVQPFITINHRI